MAEKKRVWVRPHQRGGYTVTVPGKVIKGHWRAIKPGRVRVKSAKIIHKDKRPLKDGKRYALVEITDNRGGKDTVNVSLTKNGSERSVSDILKEARSLYLRSV